VIHTVLTALVRLRSNEPFWAPQWWRDRIITDRPPALAAALAGGDAPAGTPPLARAWSVAHVHGQESLVLVRPTVLDSKATWHDDLLRAPAEVTIGAFAAAEHADAAQLRGAIHVARYERFVAVGAAPATLDEPSLARLRQLTPDFVARTVPQATPLDRVLHAVLGLLHRRGALATPAFVAPELLRTALSELGEQLGAAAPPLFLSDGRTLGVLHGRGRLRWACPSDPPRRAWRGTIPADGTVPPAAQLLVWSDEAARADAPLASDDVGPGTYSIACTAPHQLEPGAGSRPPLA